MTTKNTCLLLSTTGAQPNHRVFNIWFSKGYLSPSGYWWAHPSSSFYSYHSQPSFGKGGKDTFYKSCHSRRTDQVILPFAASTLSTQLVLAKIMLEAVDMADIDNTDTVDYILLFSFFFGPWVFGILRLFLLPYFLGKPGHTANDLRVLSTYKPPKPDLGKPQKLHQGQLTLWTIFFDGFYSFMNSLQLQSSKVSGVS